MKRRHLLHVLMMALCMSMLMGMTVAAEDWIGGWFYYAINLMGKNKMVTVMEMDFEDIFEEGLDVSQFKRSVSSSNKKVVSVKEKVKGDVWKVEAELLKPGKAYVEVKYYDYIEEQEIQSKCEFVVYKYINPFKSLKIGKKNYASKFKKRFVYNNVPVKTSGKLSYSLKKNWKVESIYNVKKNNRWVSIKKGAKVKFAKGEEIILNLKNKKTGVREGFCLTCKAGEKPFYGLVFGRD